MINNLLVETHVQIIDENGGANQMESLILDGRPRGENSQISQRMDFQRLIVHNVVVNKKWLTNSTRFILYMRQNKEWRIIWS